MGGVHSISLCSSIEPPACLSESGLTLSNQEFGPNGRTPNFSSIRQLCQ
jgi:hypothetical protein